ncbi:hypothetical protein ACKFKG_25025 [Phormidesmis sp. 146-35]
MSYRPWAIVAIFPGHRPREIVRTVTRSDAEAFARFLNRSVKQGNFYVVFDPPCAPTEE